MVTPTSQLKLFDKIRPRKTSEKIAERIRASFLDGTLKPGDKLPPDEQLAAGLGVSKSAVRESLRKLEATGVVELRAGRNGGAFIASGKLNVLSHNVLDLLHLEGVTIEQLTEARLGIEELVVRVACQHATEEDLAALDANVAHAKALFNQGLMSEKAAANVHFHNVLARATRNPFLVIVMSVLTEVITAFLQGAYADPGQATFKSRERFMLAMHARDPEAASAEMRKYLRRIGKIYEQMVKDKAAY